MTDEQWEALWAKHSSLYVFLQTINKTVLPADRPDFAGSIRNARLEMLEIQAIMDAAEGGRPVSLPSGPELDDLRQAAGSLEQAVRRGRSVVELINAANEVIATWPVLFGDEGAEGEG